MEGKKNFLKFILLLGDIFLMYGALLLTLALRYGDFSFLPGPQTKIFLFHFLFLGPVWIFLLYLLDFYKVPPLRDAFKFFYNLAVFAILAGSFGTIYFYTRSEVAISPKTILAIHVLLFSLSLSLWRFLVSKGLEILGVKEKIVLIGPSLGLSKEKINRGGFELIKRFDLNSLKIPELKKWLKRADSIVFESTLLKKEGLVKEIFEKLSFRVNYISFSDFYEEILGRVPLDKVDEGWFLINLSRPERKIDQIAKRTFDVFFSILGLFIFAFLFLFIALAIKLDSKGPIFYSQKRVGKNRKIFKVLKLRTMKHTSGSYKKVWREKQKDQITRVGRFLRRTHLDELPQFLSILRGDLSFVGPRAEWVELTKIFEKEIPFYSLRYLVRPGFTGWAQINFPASISVKQAKEKFEYDLYYIKNRSFFLDLGIILKTIRIVFKS